MDSYEELNREYAGLILIPLRPKTSEVGRLWWKHSQRKYLILGVVFAFQIQELSGSREIFKGFKSLDRE